MYSAPSASHYHALFINTYPSGRKLTSLRPDSTVRLCVGSVCVACVFVCVCVYLCICGRNRAILWQRRKRTL